MLREDADLLEFKVLELKGLNENADDASGRSPGPRSVLLALQSLCRVDAVAVHGEGQRGEESLGRGEHVAGGHLRQAGGAHGAAERS